MLKLEFFHKAESKTDVFLHVGNANILVAQYEDLNPLYRTRQFILKNVHGERIVGSPVYSNFNTLKRAIEVYAGDYLAVAVVALADFEKGVK